ncbi:reverse transcriptase family protein [Sphingomonas sp. PvP018]|uniref:reverse transcriptase family protein n=1 Tax=Sphingomonas sp. PvP018 TaxID=2817852 RepID=UPI001AE4E0EF|nr:reverse transcriptase family protein [Sphingomonas sp. PvP018]MBP2513833.1 RNA-directed DNA polymerase [Sphingomonas sp. PvP018]
MISASPNLYRSEGAERSIDPLIVEHALQQALPVERKRLPAILTLGHLAHLTGINYAYLRAIVERHADPYTPFRIGKRKGGSRLISAPEPLLLALQRWLARNVLNNIEVHHASCAYAQDCSPARCATRHLGAAWLIKVDIHDFFESITERAAWRVFRSAGYQPLISLELARLCTRQPHGREIVNPKWHVEDAGSYSIRPYRTRMMGHLPQGAPTSPMLANLASFRLDEALEALGGRYGMVYTRYSDDIAFSTGGTFDRKRAGQLIIEVERIFRSFGHALHRKKISVAPPGARKVVLGLLVHGSRLRLTGPYRRRLADHVRGVEQFGLSAHKAHRHFASLWGMVRHIQGLLGYAESVEGKAAHADMRARLDAALARDGWPDGMPPETPMPAQQPPPDVGSAAVTSSALPPAG